MIRDKGQSEKLEIIKRSLLEDSKNREKYLKIRSDKGLINEKTAKERYLFNEKPITDNKEGETMTEKPNTVVVNEDIAAKKESKPKVKKVVLSDTEKAKEKERLAKEKEKAKEKERLAKEKEKVQEKEHLAKEKEKVQEKEHLVKEKEKAKQNKQEVDKLAQEKAEQDRMKAEKLVQEKVEQDRMKAEKLAQEQVEQDRMKAEKLAQEQVEQDRVKAEKLAQEKAEEKQVQREEKVQEQDKVVEEKPESLGIQEKMRRKIAAQKLLDQGFMKSDAEKMQSKEIDIKEKLSRLEEDFSESYDDHLDKELEEAYEKIDSLINENKKLETKIAEIDKNVIKLSKQITAIEKEKQDEQKANQDLGKKLVAINQEKEDLVIKLNNVDKKFTELNQEFIKQKSELEKSNLKMEEICEELAKKEKEIATLEQNNNQSIQKDEELETQKNLYKESSKKVTELEVEKLELINHNQLFEEESNTKFSQKESELIIQKNLCEEAMKKVADLEVNKEELEANTKLLTEQKAKLQESLNDTKQKKAILLSIKYDDIFVLDKSGEDISSELKTHLEKIRKDKEDSISELENVKAELLAKNELIVAVTKENEVLKARDEVQEIEKPTLFDEKMTEISDKYDVEAEIKKIKDEISQIKQREISTLENNDQQYVINKNSNQDIYQRIRNLEQEIYQKDQQLQMIRQKFNDINEEKIIDPEFKRKIRRARDMKKELNESFEEEKKFLNRSIIQVEQQINQKKIEVTNAKEKVETIEKEYAGLTDRTSLGRESYLSKRGKALIELELFEDRVQKLDSELVALKERYDYLVQCYDERMVQLNQSEKEIIDYYLNEMKGDLIVRDKTYNVKNEEKEDLIRQLNELNQAQQQTQTAILQNSQVISKAIETNREIKEQILNDKRQNVDRNIRHLENELQEKNTECNGFISLLNTVNLKYGERMDAEKRIRTTDELVANYLKITNDIEDFTQEYHDNLNQTQEVTEKIDALIGNPDEKSEVLRLRAKLEDLDILKSDLIAKIDFLRKKSENLVNHEKVLYYSKLLESIKELKVKQEELKFNIEKLKANIAEKSADLEKAKEEKFNLE